jgi:hypothetical protein
MSTAQCVTEGLAAMRASSNREAVGQPVVDAVSLLPAGSVVVLVGENGANRAGTITLLISHRFSTVRMADHIAVLADGRTWSRAAMLSCCGSAGSTPSSISSSPAPTAKHGSRVA